MTAATSRAVEQLELIDQTIIGRYTKRGPKLVEMLVDAFLEEAPRHFQAIRQGIHASDFAAVRTSAHGLKSCSYNLGAVRLAEACKDLEARADEQQADDVQSSIELIGPTLFDTEEALKGIKFSAMAGNA